MIDDKGSLSLSERSTVVLCVMVKVIAIAVTVLNVEGISININQIVTNKRKHHHVGIAEDHNTIQQDVITILRAFASHM